VGAPPMYSIQDDGTLFVPPPNGLDELLDNAMIRILPGLKPKLSLINSLIELKDFKSIGHSSRNLLDLMQSFGKRVLTLLVSPSSNMLRIIRYVSWHEKGVICICNTNSILLPSIVI